MNGQADFPLLLGPVEIAGLSLANRVVMPPMVTAMQVGSEQHQAWYAARARGGVGLIIMEAIWAQRLCEDEFCERLEPTVAGIREYGVPVVIQLFQPGATPEGEQFAPSETDDARAATEAELAAIPARFAEAAARCRELGFAGVEPHGAHGFFLNQAFSPLRNRRDDRYGGSLERRMTLALEIVAAIRREVGPDFVIFYRHTAVEPGGYSLEDSVAFLGRLLEAGVNVLDISPSSSNAPQADHCDLAGPVRDALGAPVIAVGGMENPPRAEAALQAGKCDLCAVGRQLIADADWPRKVREGRLDDIIECVKCNEKCYGNLRRSVPIGCIENPQSGNEHRLL